MSINELKSGLVSIADAIRTKTGSSASLKIEDMPGAIQSIETGSGSGSTIQWPPDDPNEEYSWLLIDLSNYDSTEVTLNLASTSNETYSIDWGDGSGIVTFNRNSAGFGTFTHDYQTHGEFLIRLDTQGTLKASDSLFGQTTTDSSSGSSYLLPENFLLRKAIFRNSFLTTSNYSSLTACVMLEEIKYNSTAATEPLSLTYCANLKDAEFTGTFTKFYKGYGLCNCTSLQTLNIDAPITEIPAYFLYRAYSLKSFDCPSTVTKFSTDAFDMCKALEEINLPSQLQEISNYAFYGCEALRTFDCPSTVSSIGTYAFYACKSLEEFDFPSAVSSISQSCFYDCTNLRKFNGHDGITSIGTYAFYGCSSLTSFIVPAGVTSIYAATFSGCTSLEHFVILNPTSVVSLKNVNAFTNTTCNFYVPVDLVDSYKNATNWITYADRIFPLSECPADVYSAGNED